MPKLFHLVAAPKSFCLITDPVFVAIPLTNYSQTAENADIKERIRAEGMERSQIMTTMHVLTDI
ncbi:MAG TPA: hypothetical protein VIB00_02855 [Pyrinomonadaceae bacterium]